jgi:hypothetical protein
MPTGEGSGFHLLYLNKAADAVGLFLFKNLIKEFLI